MRAGPGGVLARAARWALDGKGCEAMEIIDYGAIDWRGSWKELQRRRNRVDDPAAWDARADGFAKRKRSDYAERFIEMLALEEGESVLDMGCGTGELACAMARDGHACIAADFSPRMLAHLKRACEEEGLGNVTPLAMSWTDDWEAAGVGEGCVDVAIASRSIMVPDLGEAFEKLSRTARRKVAVTLAAGASPSEDATLLAAIGRRTNGHLDVPFAFNILIEMGYWPELRYIATDKKYEYASPEEAVADSLGRIRDLTPGEAEAAERFVRKHLVECGEGRLTLDYRRAADWAFISWNVG